MRSLTNICLALSLAALPFASAATVDNQLFPEVRERIQVYKQSPLF